MATLSLAGMLRRSLVHRRARSVSALVAMTVSAGVATALLTLYADLDAKLHKEFRSFGANIVINAPEGKSLSDQDMRGIQAQVNRHGLAVPFSYAVAHTDSGQAVVVAGTDLELARSLNPWWSVSAWPQSSGEALVGLRAARVLSPEQKAFKLRYQYCCGLSLCGCLLNSQCCYYTRVS